MSQVSTQVPPGSATPPPALCGAALGTSHACLGTPSKGFFPCLGPPGDPPIGDNPMDNHWGPLGVDCWGFGVPNSHPLCFSRSSRDFKTRALSCIHSFPRTISGLILGWDLVFFRVPHLLPPLLLQVLQVFLSQSVVLSPQLCQDLSQIL